jgi:hypothetical protein
VSGIGETPELVRGESPTPDAKKALDSARGGDNIFVPKSWIPGVGMLQAALLPPRPRSMPIPI